MQFNSVQSGNFLTGAKSVTDAATEIYDTAQETGFQVDKVIKQANANEAVKKVAASRRNALMAQTGLEIGTKVKTEDIKTKRDKAIKDIWRPAVRMEGVNRLAGSVAAGAMIMDEAKLQQKEMAALQAERDKYRTAMENIAEQNSAFFKEEQELRQLKIQQLRKELNLPSPTTIQDSPTNTSSTPNQSSTSSPVFPANVSSNNPNPTPKQVFDFMKELGVSDVHAKGVLANIKGESGFQTGVMGDGGTSGGLFQMHAGRYNKMVNNVPDWKTNWKGQIVHGLKDDRAPEYLKMKFDSPVQAANWFLHNYERPAQEHRPGREKLNESFIGSLNF